jgi:hypothetical protein
MKNIRYIILILLTVAAAYFFFTNQNSTIKSEKSDFGVKDTSSITKLFLADQQGRQVTLERLSEFQWKVNGKYLARQDGINILLETIKRVAVKAPVNKAAFENIVKNISSSSVKVEIYTGDDSPSKVYYVGSSNQDHSGTYMLMENSTVPFLTHMEGFYGYLTPRYFTNENEWRDRTIFRYNYGEIASIKVEIPLDKENSFEITSNADNTYSIKSLATGNTIENFDTLKVLEYISYYKTIPYEGFEETKTEEYMNGVKASTPLNIYTVTDKSGKESKATTYLKPLPEGATDPEGTPIYFDMDRLYADVNETDFVVIQYIIFDKLDKKLSDFRK